MHIGEYYGIVSTRPMTSTVLQLSVFIFFKPKVFHFKLSKKWQTYWAQRWIVHSSGRPADGVGLETDFYWKRPEKQPITALEEITKLLSAFSSKTFAVFHPFHLKGVSNLSMPLLARIDLKMLP